MKILILNAPDMSVAPYYSQKGLTIQEDHLDLPGTFPLKAIGQVEDASGKMFTAYTVDCIKAVRKLVRPGEYHAVVFCYDATPYQPEIGETGGFTECSDDVYLGTWLCTVRLDGNEGLYTTHELLHTFTHKLERIGLPVNDIMDLTPISTPTGVQLVPYYKNNFPNDPDSNYNRQWALIEPYKHYLEFPTPILKYGQRNFWVTMFQSQLTQLGYSFPAWGYFGPLTRKAVVDLQKKNGLTPDAIVGPLTLSVAVIK